MKTTRALDTLVSDAAQELTMPAENPTLERVLRFVSWKERQDERVRRTTWVLSLGAALHVVAVVTLGFSFKLPPGVPSSALTALAVEMSLAFLVPLSASAAVLTLIRRSGYVAQIAARTLLWGACMLAAMHQLLLSSVSNLTETAPIESAIAVLWNLVAATAAWTLGDDGLRTPRRLERGPLDALLSLSLVMGLADAVVMAVVALFFSLVTPIEPWAVLGLSSGLVFGALGLFRGRVWGLLVMATCNLAEILVVVSGGLGGPANLQSAMGPVLMLTAFVQLLLPLPVYVAMFSGWKAWAEGLSARAPSISRVLSLVALVLIAAPSAIFLAVL